MDSFGRADSSELPTVLVRRAPQFRQRPALRVLGAFLMLVAVGLPLWTLLRKGGEAEKVQAIASQPPAHNASPQAPPPSEASAVPSVVEIAATPHTAAPTATPHAAAPTATPHAAPAAHPGGQAATRMAAPRSPAYKADAAAKGTAPPTPPSVARSETSAATQATAAPIKVRLLNDERIQPKVVE
jgi:hypothetical protein